MVVKMLIQSLAGNFACVSALAVELTAPRCIASYVTGTVIMSSAKSLSCSPCYYCLQVCYWPENSQVLWLFRRAVL